MGAGDDTSDAVFHRTVTAWRVGSQNMYAQIRNLSTLS